MISDIPSHDDFRESGLALLGLAWDMVVALLADLEATDCDEQSDPEMTGAFWDASRQTLTTAIAMAQQAVEFVLKGRIVAVSPYLLIAGSPREWPRRCDKHDVPFAEFRTLDAQDLIRVHDAVASERLDPSLVDKFDELRRMRNSVMHTVDRRLSPASVDVIRDILTVFRLLFPGRSWFEARREYLDRSPMSQLHSTDHADPQLVWEFELVLKALGPDGATECFGLVDTPDAVCPVCSAASDYMELRPRSAYLNESEGLVSCIICGESTSVVGADCEDCDAGLLGVNWGYCVRCGGWIG